MEIGHVASLGPCRGQIPRAGDRERVALLSLWDRPVSSCSACLPWARQRYGAFGFSDPLPRHGLERRFLGPSGWVHGHSLGQKRHAGRPLWPGCWLAPWQRDSFA